MNELIIYTDGGAHNESGHMHGIGSSAWMDTTHINDNSKQVVLYGRYYKDTTNNKTEMMAVINAIKMYKNKDNIINIISDSGYLVKGYTDPSYLDAWVANGWVTSSKTPVKNKELWEKLIALSWHNKFRFKLIKGHGRDKNITHAFYNDIVDRCCTHIMNNAGDDDNSQLYRLIYNIDTKKIISTKVEIYYFTFGSGQKYEGMCQPIISTSCASARDKMFDMYGKDWSFQYSEDKWDKINSIYKEIELPIVVDCEI